MATDADAFWNVFGGNNTDADAINIHVVKELEGAGGSFYELTDAIVIPRSVFDDYSGTTTLAHEIGHYFNLEHTHRNATKGKCTAEAVSRTRHFTAAQFFGCVPPRTGLICEKTGDFLCDTPADPELIWGGTTPGTSKVSNSCQYTWGEIDNLGDAYVPDESNIMSYSRRFCRTFFSPGQVNVMAHSMLSARNALFDIIDLNETDPDIYEPDDSDFSGVPRAITMGETQCHSFYDISECADPADWLIMTLNQGVIGSYQIKIDDVDAAANPVEKVVVWNMGADLMRSTEIGTNSYMDGSTMVFEFPCVAPSNSRYLIEVMRKSNVTEGLYKITLTSDNPLSIYGNELLCRTSSYTIGTLPSGATVAWTSSSNITLGNFSGPTTTIQQFTSGSPSAYWIEATVTSGSCSQTVRKTFTYTSIGGVPAFFILEKDKACFPGGGEYYISNPAGGITYNWSCTGTPCGNINPVGNGTTAYVGPISMGLLTIIVTATDGCGNSYTQTKVVQVKKCDGKLQGLVMNPNPTSNGRINVTVDDMNDLEGEYQVLITNQMSEIKYQSTKSSKDFEVDLSTLPNGVYYIHVSRDDNAVSAWFIINK